MSRPADDKPQCPNCASREFKRGYVQAQDLQFRADNASWVQRNFTLGMRLRGAVRRKCSYLLLFARKDHASN